MRGVGASEQQRNPEAADRESRCLPKASRVVRIDQRAVKVESVPLDFGGQIVDKGVADLEHAIRKGGAGFVALAFG
jgi:hypothetical protein